MSVLFDLTNLSPEVFAFLVSMVIKGILIFALALCLNLLLKKVSAAARHIIWVLAFAAVSLLPLLILTVPSVDVPVLPAYQEPAIIEPIAEPASFDTTPIIKPVWPIMPTYQTPTPVEEPEPQPQPIPEPQPQFSIGQYLIITWAVGAIICMIPVSLRLISLSIFQTKCKKLKSAGVHQAVAEVSAQLNIRKKIRVITNDESGDRLAPMVWGAFPPILFLPKSNGLWTSQQLRSVLLHELAHIKRHDWLSQLFCGLVAAAYWFNPFCWYGLKRLRAEREQACDDLVLSSGIDSADYAQHLVKIARNLICPRPVNSAALAMARSSQIEARIKAILDITRNRRAVSRAMLCVFTITVAAVSISLAALQPVEKKAREPKDKTKETILDQLRQNNPEKYAEFYNDFADYKKTHGQAMTFAAFNEYANEHKLKADRPIAYLALRDTQKPTISIDNLIKIFQDKSQSIKACYNEYELQRSPEESNKYGLPIYEKVTIAEKQDLSFYEVFAGNSIDDAVIKKHNISDGKYRNDYQLYLEHKLLWHCYLLPDPTKKLVDDYYTIEYLKDRECLVQEKLEIIDGRPCLYLTDGIIHLYFDPALNYSVVHFKETLHQEDNTGILNYYPVNEHFFSDFEDCGDNIYLPKKIVAKEFEEGKETGEKWVLSVNKIAINKTDAIPDKLFEEKLHESNKLIKNPKVEISDPKTLLKKLNISDKSGDLTLNAIMIEYPGGKNLLGKNSTTLSVGVTNHSDKTIYLGMSYYADSGTVAGVFSPGTSSMSEIKTIKPGFKGDIDFTINHPLFVNNGHLQITFAKCSTSKTEGISLPTGSEIFFERDYRIEKDGIKEIKASYTISPEGTYYGIDLNNLSQAERREITEKMVSALKQSIDPNDVMELKFLYHTGISVTASLENSHLQYGQNSAINVVVDIADKELYEMNKLDELKFSHYYDAFKLIVDGQEYVTYHSATAYPVALMAPWKISLPLDIWEEPRQDGDTPADIKPLQLAPGKHKIQVGFIGRDNYSLDKYFDGTKDLKMPISDEFEIEISDPDIFNETDNLKSLFSQNLNLTTTTLSGKPWTVADNLKGKYIVLYFWDIDNRLRGLGESRLSTINKYMDLLKGRGDFVFANVILTPGTNTVIDFIKNNNIPGLCLHEPGKGFDNSLSKQFNVTQSRMCVVIDQDGLALTSHVDDFVRAIIEYQDNGLTYESLDYPFTKIRAIHQIYKGSLTKESVINIMKSKGDERTTNSGEELEYNLTDKNGINSTQIILSFDKDGMLTNIGQMSNPVSKYDGGNGTAAAPYRISSGEQMNNIGLHEEDWDKHFILTNDITIGNMSYNIIGYQNHPGDSHPFTGVFDGDNHKIKALSITADNTEEPIGLFGLVGSSQASGKAELKNITIVAPEINIINNKAHSGTGALAGSVCLAKVTNCHVLGGNINGVSSVGGLIGSCLGSQVSNCSAKIEISGTYSVGGLVGVSTSDSTITKCSASTSAKGKMTVGGLVGDNQGKVIQCFSTGTVEGDQEIGGLVGRATSEGISNCYSTATVSGNDEIGGLIGVIYASEPIEYCFSTGKVTGKNRIGGFIGYCHLAEINNCFWNIETSSITKFSGDGKTYSSCHGLSSKEMTMKESFTNWDFQNNWKISDNSKYPKLKWE